MKTINISIMLIFLTSISWVKLSLASAASGSSSQIKMSAHTTQETNIFKSFGFEWNPDMLFSQGLFQGEDIDSRTFFISAKPPTLVGGTSGRLANITKNGSMILEVLGDDHDFSRKTSVWPYGFRQQVEFVTPPYPFNAYQADLRDSANAVTSLFSAIVNMCNSDPLNEKVTVIEKDARRYCHIPMTLLAEKGLSNGYHLKLTSNGEGYARRQGGLGFTLSAPIGRDFLFFNEEPNIKALTQATVGVRLQAFINLTAINLLFTKRQKTHAILQNGAGVRGWMLLPGMTLEAAGFLNLLCVASYMEAGTDPSWNYSAPRRNAWGGWLKTPIYVTYIRGLDEKNKELVNDALNKRTFFSACQNYVYPQKDEGEETPAPSGAESRPDVIPQKLADVLQGMTPARVSRFAQKGPLEKHGSTQAMESDPGVVLIEIRDPSMALPDAGALVINDNLARIKNIDSIGDLFEKAQEDAKKLSWEEGKCPTTGPNVLKASKLGWWKSVLMNWCARALGPKRIR